MQYFDIMCYLYKCIISFLVLYCVDRTNCQPGSVGSTQTCAVPYWTDQLKTYSVCKQ